MPTFAIEAQQLRKEFGKKVAVADLTLQVEQGEVFGFLGPNGAGKTTSIKMLLGLITPTSGTAQLLSKPLGNREIRRRIGYLPEHFRFYGWLKAAEFLDLHGKLYGIPKAERRALVSPLLKRVGLAGRENTKLEAFSKGMTQRIGLAQALMNEPDLVILDEPTSGLDPIGRKLVRDIIREISQQGTTVFVNSHLLSEIEKTCHRAAFIREGYIVETHNLSDFGDSVRVQLRLAEIPPTLPAQLAQFGTDIRSEQTTISLTLVAGESAIPELVNWLTTNGHALYELKPQHLSLEDRFIQIVGESEDE